MLNTKNNFLENNKELLISLILALVCLFLANVFPAKNTFQALTKNAFFLIAVPALYIKFVLKKNLSDFGFNLKNNRQGIYWSIIGIIVSLAAAWLIFKFTNFRLGYKLPDYVAGSFWLYMVYELIFVNFFVFVQSVFFRGFLLFTLEEKVGVWAWPIQSIIYLLFVLLSGGLNWLATPYVITSVSGGLIAWKSKSFIHSYFMSLLFIILLDAFIIRFYFS